MDNRLIEIIQKSNSKNQVLIEYYGYANKRTYQLLNFFIKENNLDVTHMVKKKPKCLNCGKEIDSYEKKFCNSSCAAIFNNKNRKLSQETRQKISLSLLGKKKNSVKNLEEKLRECKICKKTFIVSRIKNGSLSHSETCSNDCNKLLKSINSKRMMEKRISEGKHKGWATRNIISYPELFFMKVLMDNNILYQHNYPVAKKDLGIDSPYNYFLDFYIENKRIDLEIDGKQHMYRVDHDDLRDNALINHGFYVYRIKWQSINTKPGQEYIKNEIDKFLNFYNEY